jgi:hypothetical protein
MKLIGYNFMAVMFLAFAAWLAWLGSSYWGWGLVLSFLTTVKPGLESESRVEKEEEKPQPTEEEINLLKEIRSHFKNKDKE